MLRKSRITLAAVFFIGITLLFLGTAGTTGKFIGWMADIQFLPAVLAINIPVIIGLILLTLVFGRIYCSVICPLGVWQDIVSWASSRRKGKSMRFHFSKEKKWLRYTIWLIYIAALAAGVQVIVALIAPYSTYGRFVSNLTGIKSLPTFIVAATVFVAVTVIAWLNGRQWCNDICPVGTTLSFFSRFSLLRPIIDTSKCKNCKVCAKKCKSGCIDVETHTIDYSRCVDCFDCIESCKSKAIRYGTASKSKSKAETPSEKGADASRRAFLASTAMIAAAFTMNAQNKKAAEATKAVADSVDDKKVDGGLAELLPKQEPERSAPLTPFGSQSARNFYRKCTACQLCVSSCPNKVLKPSTSAEHFMQPQMSFVDGYCRPECTLCSQICPAGAIEKITAEEKTSIHIGIAAVDYDLCVVNRDGVKCGNCARHCPVGAIMMVRKDPEDKNSPRIPTVNEEKCIGCGACEYLCPSRPISAIHVNGRSAHIQN